MTIGQPVRIQARTLRLGTDLRALLSRQIAHAVTWTALVSSCRFLRLARQRNRLLQAESSGWPVEIVSIDEIVLNGVEVVSGRTLKGDVVAVPHAAGVTLRTIELSAEDTRFSER